MCLDVFKSEVEKSDAEWLNAAWRRNLEARKAEIFARSLLGFLASKFNFFDMLV